MYRLTFVVSALLLSACSSPTAPERLTILPVASTALNPAPVAVTPAPVADTPAPVAVTPAPVASAPPPALVAAGCSDRLDSSWWWERPTGAYYFNGCDKPLNYVLAHFRVNTVTWSSDQTLLSMTEELVQAGAYGRQHTTSVTECSQLDLYVGITIDDINSGRVTIHPRDEGKPHFVSALEGWYGSLGAACGPPPPPADCRAAIDRPTLTNGSDGRVQLEFFIKPGYTNIEVSLVSLSAVIPGQFLPQEYRDGESGFFSAGGPYYLAVDVYDTWQVDGLCGPLRLEELNESNIAEDAARTFIFTHTGATGFVVQ